ncbi:hypothetical protein PJP10_06890 [Mycobacterium kansasii]|nr:hypothetical protein MKSMC1_26730 [Mycobacterium kansasii]
MPAGVVLRGRLWGDGYRSDVIAPADDGFRLPGCFQDAAST